MRALLPVAKRQTNVSKWLGLGGLAALLVAVSAVRAAPKVEADPNRDYRITPEVGPWMICAAAYTGPTSQALAKQLVLLIRQRDNLPAYYFDRGEKERREQEEQLKKVREFSPPDRRIRAVRIPDQYAVLIGGYPDMESARRALNAVKKLKLPELNVPGMTAYDVIPDPQTGQRLAVNPFATAFVTRNPSLPPSQHSQDKGDDPFLKELNAGEEYSLLQCRKPYTLCVKIYQGVSVTKSGSGSLLDKIGLRKSPDTLSASALQAHELAKLLRSKELNLEAYVLHTRKESYVTVGGFESQEDRALYEMQQRLAKLSFKAGGNGTPAAGDILQLFVPAIPMRVPRP
jgi:hypothetical protein